MTEQSRPTVAELEEILKAESDEPVEIRRDGSVISLAEKDRQVRREIQNLCAEILDKDDFGSPAFDVACWALWQAMDGGQREVFKQILFKGPVYDGDIASKAARGTLFQLGLAVRCCFKGEPGFTAASYRAYTVYTRSGDRK